MLMQVVSDVAAVTQILAEEHGILHRDYSPANVMTLDGRGLLIDFSSAKVWASLMLADDLRDNTASLNCQWACSWHHQQMTIHSKVSQCSIL